MTRKQYTTKNNELTNKLNEVRNILKLAEETNGENLENIESWNEYYDQERDIETEIKDLEHAFETRNWTAGMRETANLMMNNID